MKIKAEVYKTDHRERPVRKGETESDLKLSDGDIHVWTYRIVDEKGSVLYSPAWRAASEHAARRVAERRLKRIGENPEELDRLNAQQAAAFARHE